MTKKALFIIALTAVLSLLLCLSAFPAMKGSKTSKVNSYAVWHKQMKKFDQAKPSMVPNSNEVASAERVKIPLGKAFRMEGQGVGTRVEETYDDLQYQSTIILVRPGENTASPTSPAARHIDVAEVTGGGVDVHFQFSMLSNEDSVNYYGSGYQEYAAGETSDNWIFNDQLGGYRLQPDLDQGGRFGSLALTHDGLAVMSTLDAYGEFAAVEDSGLDHSIYWQTSQWDFPTTINYPTRASYTGLIGGTAGGWFPLIATSHVGGQTIGHCGMVAWEGLSGTEGLFRIVYYLNTDGSDPSGWRKPSVACSSASFLQYSMAANPNGTEVAFLYTRWTSTGLLNPSNYGFLDTDLWVAESDTGDTWVRTNITNYGPTRSEASYTTFAYSDWSATAMYDANDNLHVLFVAKPVGADPYRNGWEWGYVYDCDLMHWTPSVGISKVADATYAPFAQYDCGGLPCPQLFNGLACGYGHDQDFAWIQEPRMSQCGDYLYATWSQMHWKANELTGSSLPEDTTEAMSDCSDMDVAFKVGANSDLFVAVSSDLTGLLWDTPRNLSNTFTPDCSHPDSVGGTLCGNEIAPMLSVHSIDTTGLSLTWPVDATNAVIPKSKTGGYTFESGKYLMVQYIDDLIPGSYIAADSGVEVANYPTDIRWFRMACVNPEGAPDIEVDPSRFVWPLYVENNDVDSFTVTLTNSGNLLGEVDLTVSETSPTNGWLSITETEFDIPAGVSNTATFDIVVTAPSSGMTFLQGVVHVLSNDPDNPDQEVYLNLWSGPTVEEPGIYDTAATSTDWDGKGLNDFVALTASNHGEQGGQGIGEVNMDFLKGGTECDSAATVYLYSSSPFVLIKGTGGVSTTTSHYSTNVGSGHTWTPLTTATISSGVGSANDKDYDSLFTGRMANRDSTVWMERTFYAPRNNASLPNFVAVKTVLGCDATITDSIAVGEATDWDVPADALGTIGSPNTSATTQPTEEQFVYFQGYADSAGCAVNTQRYATNAYYIGYTEGDDPCEASDEFWGSWGMNVRTHLDLDTVTNEPPVFWWDSLYEKSGLWATSDQIDQGQFLTYEYMDGLTAGSNKVYWTIYVTAYQLTAYTDLVSDVTGAKAWVAGMLGCGSCCMPPFRGNVDYDAGDQVSLGDLTALIDVLFISLEDPECFEEANVDASLPDGPGSISLGDLTALIDVLFISLDDPPPCP
jgi:hypothetical protein